MKNKKIEWLLLVSITIISLFGIVMIYSASNIWEEYKYQDAFKYVRHQAIFFVIAKSVIAINDISIIAIMIIEAPVCFARKTRGYPSKAPNTPPPKLKVPKFQKSEKLKAVSFVTY